MTAHEFYDLWPLWTYISGFATTIIGQTAIATYNEDNTSNFEDFVAPVIGLSIIWPLYFLYLIGKGSGLVLKSHKKRILTKKREQKQLAEQHAKLLREAGL